MVLVGRDHLGGGGGEEREESHISSEKNKSDHALHTRRFLFSS